MLPEVFPETRTRVTRAAKATAKAERIAAQVNEASETPDAIPTKEETALAIIPETPIFAAPTKTEEPATMEILYNVTGPRRKELAAAVGDFIGAKPKYMKAPTYAFVVEEYTIGRDGTYTGKENKALVEVLTAQGFINLSWRKHPSWILHQ